MSDTKSIILLGGGGHAEVLVELINYLGAPIIGFTAPERGKIKGYPNVDYLCTDQQLIDNYPPTGCLLVNGIGSTSNHQNIVRQQLFERFKALGYQFATLIHPSAIIASTAQVKEGVQIMAKSVVQPNVIVSENTLINTGVNVDHDCYIESHVHLAPAVTLCGGVHVGQGAFIGVGATLIQGLKVANHAMVRAGTTHAYDILGGQPTVIKE